MRALEPKFLTNQEGVLAQNGHAFNFFNFLTRSSKYENKLSVAHT